MRTFNFGACTYTVCEDGSIFDCLGNEVRQYVNHYTGYVTVSLRFSDTERKAMYVHRIMGLVYLGLGAGGTVDHIDGDRSNNALSNLRIVTPRENHNFVIARERHAAAARSNFIKRYRYRVEFPDGVIVEGSERDLCSRFGLTYSPFWYARRKVGGHRTRGGVFVKLIAS